MAMRRVFFVRHAKALERERWLHHPDDQRPLTDLGFRQADAIARELRRLHIDRIISSRAYRCVDTVWPLADAIGLTVTPHDALFEGASPSDTITLMRRVRARNVVLCTHGDVMEGVLEQLDDDGVELDGGIRFGKAAYWLLEISDEGEIVAGTYNPAPRV